MADLVSSTPSELVLSDQLPPDRNPAIVFLARMTTLKSRKAMSGALALIVEVVTGSRQDPSLFPWHQLRYTHAAAIRARLVDRVARATANHALSALKGTIREAWKLGLISSEDMTRICARDALPPIKGESLPKGRYVTPAELEALFQAAGSGSLGARNAALLAVMFGGGLRRAEIVGLELTDYDPITGELTVRGKGHRTRIVPLPVASQNALSAWLDVRGRQAAGRLFQAALGRRGEVFRATLSEQSLTDILSWLAARAKIAKFSPHDTRRTFISDVIDRTGDIGIAAKLAGHSSVTTTQRYDRRPEAAKRRAVDQIHIPYTGKIQ